MFWPFMKSKKKEVEENPSYSIVLSSEQAIKVLIWKGQHDCTSVNVSKRKIWMRQDKIGKKKVTTIKCDMCSKVHVL